MNRNAAWPAEKGGHQRCRRRTWETKVKKSPGRQMNRNAAWPAEKGVQAPNLGDKSKEITWECMASGKGRTPAVTERPDTS